jgi:hypothetical protein
MTDQQPTYYDPNFNQNLQQNVNPYTQQVYQQPQVTNHNIQVFNPYTPKTEEISNSEEIQNDSYQENYEPETKKYKRTYKGFLGSCCPGIFLTLNSIFILISVICLLVTIIGIVILVTNPKVFVAGVIMISLGSTFLIIMLTFFILVLTFCSIELICNPYAFRLRNIFPSNKVHEDINRWKNESPIIKQHVECYHYVTHRTKNGTSTRKVTTFMTSEVFKYSSCVDKSGNFEDSDNNVTNVDYLTTWEPADEKTKQAHQQWRDYFVNTHKHRDSHFRTHQTIEYSNFAPFVVAYHRKPKCLSFQNYCLFSIFWCTIPYRLWVDSISGDASVALHKVCKV